MVWVPGSMFRMGSDGHYPEEAPVHSVSVDGFWIDRTPVTNRKFREFVRATGYITLNGAIERIVGLLCNIRGRSDIFSTLAFEPIWGSPGIDHGG